MRALEPVHQGRIEIDGVGIAYEVFGTGDRTIVLAPAWAIVNSHSGRGRSRSWRGASA